MNLLHRARKWVRQRVAARAKARLIASIGSAGEGVKINGRGKILRPHNVTLEDNVHIGDNAFIDALGGVRIGANTHISRNLVLYTANHDYKGERLPYDENMNLKPVDIGRNVWIGANVSIVPGAKIGDGAIVGTGTVVAGEVPALAIIAPQPYRIIGERNVDHYERLEVAGIYGGVGGRPLQIERS